MADLPNREEIFQIGATEILLRNQSRPSGSRITRDAIYSPGSDVNIMLAAGAAMADETVRQEATRNAALWLDSSVGDDLDRLVADRTNNEMPRKLASPALVQLSFSRSIPPSPGLSYTIPIGEKFSTSDGIEFELVEPVAFGAGSSGPITGDAQAVFVGTLGNVDNKTITKFVVSSGEPGLVVTNPSLAAGGAEDEDDVAYRYRARQYFKASRRGVIGALEIGALQVPGVVSATAEEELDSTGIQTGLVRVYIADINGQSNSVLTTAVSNVLREYRAAGIVPDVISSYPEMVSIAYAVSFRAGIDTTIARQQIKTATLSAVNSLAPGESLLRSALISVLRSVPGVIVYDGAVIEPAGDLVVTGGNARTLKTRLDLVTVNGI